MTRIAEGIRGDNDSGFFAIKNAKPKSVADVLRKRANDDEGRSQWVWVRLPNGDVMLGVFPQGDTYSQHEREYP